jgi:hypothetical protein
MIDTVPPVTTDNISGNLTSSGWYTGTVTITMNATDATSGVATADTVLDFCRLFQGNSTITVSTTGRHSLLFTSTDVAGNEELLHYVTFNIDNTPPDVVAVDSVQSLGKGNWQITVWGYADDYASGLAPTPPSFTVSDSSGPLSPTAVTNTMRSGHFFTQFNVFLPSTVPPASTSSTSGKGQSSHGGHDRVSITLQIMDNVGNKTSKTVQASM